jgi:hypothetical protein
MVAAVKYVKSELKKQVGGQVEEAYKELSQIIEGREKEVSELELNQISMGRRQLRNTYLSEGQMLCSAAVIISD